MKCHEFGDNLDDFVRGLLDEETAGKMRAHLETCVSCAGECELHQKLLDVLRDEPALVVSPQELADFVPGVWEKIALRRPSPGKRVLRYLPALAVAALLALLILKPVAMNKETPTIVVGTADDSTVMAETYQELLSESFADDTPEILNMIETELYDEGSWPQNFDEYLETLSQEGLEMLDKKLTELSASAG